MINQSAGGRLEEANRVMRSFQESRVFLTAIELDIFTAVGEGAKADEVAKKILGDPRATQMLLNALVAIGLVSKSQDVYQNNEVGRQFGDGGRAAGMHAVNLWDRWSTLTECVRHGTSVTFEEIGERTEEWTEAFIAAMHKSAGARAPGIVGAVGLDGVTRVLDVGGGSGAYSLAFADAKKDLHAVVFDLPSVTPIARGHIEAAGLSQRVSTQDGDFRRDELGSGFDLVFLSSICHMNGPEENEHLCAKAYSALNPRGRVVIQDFILEQDKTAPKIGALFALNMLVGTRHGDSYSEVEYKEVLEKVGFKQVQRLDLSSATGLMIGRK